MERTPTGQTFRVSGFVGTEGRPGAVDGVTLRQVTDKYAPPDKALVRLAAVGDLLFLTVVTSDETATATTQTQVAGYTFDIDSFGDAVSLLIRDRDRSAVREKV